MKLLASVTSSTIKADVTYWVPARAGWTIKP